MLRLRLQKNRLNNSGFTIVELLIVIVVIAVLAAITIAVFNGVQQRSRDARRASDIRNVSKLIENYNALNGSYPSTGGLYTVYADSNCQNKNTNKRSDWVPNVGTLPQSIEPRKEWIGCYLYASDGKQYILSAWVAIESGKQTSSMYRRLGFREGYWSDQDNYYCSNSAGNDTYWNDHYQKSYTVSNITTCNENL